jgi:hypothetical protein
MLRTLGAGRQSHHCCASKRALATTALVVSFALDIVSGLAAAETFVGPVIEGTCAMGPTAARLPRSKTSSANPEMPTLSTNRVHGTAEPRSGSIRAHMQASKWVECSSRRFSCCSDDTLSVCRRSSPSHGLCKLNAALHAQLVTSQRGTKLMNQPTSTESSEKTSSI